MGIKLKTIAYRNVRTREIFVANLPIPSANFSGEISKNFKPYSRDALPTLIGWHSNDVLIARKLSRLIPNINFAPPFCPVSLCVCLCIACAPAASGPIRAMGIKYWLLLWRDKVLARGVQTLQAGERSFSRVFCVGIIGIQITNLGGS